MGLYSSSPDVDISSKLTSVYIQVDCLTPVRLGLSIGCVGDGDDVATGLVRPVVRGDDVALGFNAVNFDNITVLPSSSSYDDAVLKSR